jgi:hypothetical protein
MRFPMKLALASLMAAGAMAVAPALPASAAPVPGAHGATAVARPGGLAVPLTMKPGTHKISESIRVTSRPSSRQAAPSISGRSLAGCNSYCVSVRAGPYNCAGFNGQITWYAAQPPPHFNSYVIIVYGIMWDDCGKYEAPTTTYVYLSYNCASCYPRQNYSIDSLYAPSSHYNYSTGVNSTTGTPSGWGPSDVQLTACIEAPRGWSCGASQSF